MVASEVLGSSLMSDGCRRKSRVPPASDIIDIACQAQQRVEASVPPPPSVSRTSSSSSLQQQLVPESTRHTIEMVLSSTAQSPSKLLQFGRNVVSQKLKSQLSGLSGGQNKSAAVPNEGAVLYHPTDSPSPGGSFEQLVGALSSDVDGQDPTVTGSQTDVSNHVDNTQSNGCKESVGLTTEVNLIDLSFEDSTDNLMTLADSEDARPSDIDVTHSLAVDAEKASDQELAVTNDLVDIQSTASQSSGSPAPPAILLNDMETSSMRTDRPLCRRHSLLKMSHSESSLSMSLATASSTPQGATSAHDMRALDMVVDDDIDLAVSSAAAGGGVSGFSRLLQGGKLAAASLMVPRGSGMSAAAAATRRRQLEELAKNRLAKSQLRFKECRTCIILL